MKDMSHKVVCQLESTDSTPSLLINPSSNRKVVHVLVGNKKNVNFGRHDLPLSLPRSAIKRVSRHHCQICWNAQIGNYDLKVTGTNGIKYFGNFYGPGEHLNISSGSVIDFVGLKVLFLDSESSELATHIQVAPPPETCSDNQNVAVPLMSLPSRASDEAHSFSKTALEDSTQNNISSAVNSLYEPPKPNKLVNYDESLKLKDSALATDKNILVESDDYVTKKAFKLAERVLTDTLPSCVESKKASTSIKRKQKVLQETDSSPPISNLTPENGKSNSPEDLWFPEETFKKDIRASSESTSDNMVFAEPTPSIKLLDQEMAQPEDEMFIDLVLQTLVSMGKRTPVSLKSLLGELLRVQPNLDLTPAILASRLSRLPMFIRVPALGPIPELKNDQYYYSPELDWNPSRKVEIGTLVRKPRGCTLSSKQYYFKPLPKLPKYKGPGFKKH